MVSELHIDSKSRTESEGSMRRIQIPLVLLGMFVVLLGFFPTARTTSAQTCNGTVSVVMTSGGPGQTTTASFTNNDTVCAHEVGHTSYEITERQGDDDSWIRTQRKFDSASGVVPAAGTLELTVRNPNCAFQTDAYNGRTAAEPPFYGDRLLQSVVDNIVPPLCTSQKKLYIPMFVHTVSSSQCLSIAVVHFGWSEDKTAEPSAWYAVGDSYPTQRPGTNLWLLLDMRPGDSYYIVSAEFIPTEAGKQAENWGEFYPGAGMNPHEFLVHENIQPGYVHIAVFYRASGLDCEIGQFKLKIDDNGPTAIVQ
jgi:hypothetical protein